MTDASTNAGGAGPQLPPKHPRFLFHFHRSSNAHGWVRAGLDSSFIATFAVLSIAAWPFLFNQATLQFILEWWGPLCLLYVALQFTAIAARNPVELGQTFKDDIYSLGPAFASLAVLVMWLFVINMPTECLKALAWGAAVAAIDIIDGRALANRILGQPYARKETETRS